jgi:hypothetical protein
MIQYTARRKNAGYENIHRKREDRLPKAMAGYRQSYGYS